MITCQNKLDPSNRFPVLAKTNLILEQSQDNKESADSVQAINYLKMVKWRLSVV